METRWILTVAALAALASTGSALAQNFPERPIMLVNPYAAGGPADLLARTVAASMTETLGQPVVVENKAGAGTAIGARFVAKAKPDGYTLFIGGSPSHVIAPALVKDAGFDGIKDFATVAMVASVPNVLVVPASKPSKSVKDLVAAAKAANGSMTFASVGVGSLPQFLGLLLQQRADVKLTHVPYGGAAPAVVDLLAGNVDMAFLNIAPVLAHVKDGKLRALAVANDRRAERLPDVPTMEEVGFKGIEMSTWYGISAPAGTPRPVIDKLHTAIASALKSESVKEKLTSQGAEILLKSPDEFEAFLKADAERMLGLIKVAGMKAN
ncbi:MAG: tripartite tricarboxylate transporter substrate binding protein [Xanthobacteraceae bacterium]